jgi:ribose-phosphate pyrophosphokinase
MLAATHPVFAGPAVERVKAAGIDQIIATNTVPLRDEVQAALPEIKVLSVAPLLGEAIQRIHRNESVSALFRRGKTKMKV